MKLLWCNDLHFDFLSRPEIDTFIADVKENNPDALLIGGDISVSRRVTRDLKYLAEELDRPIYFVLGNHDYYGSSIDSVRARMSKLTKKHKHLHWLPEAGVIPLRKDACLIGHDGWNDGRYGDYLNSNITLTDYEEIEDLSKICENTRLKKLNDLGDDAASRVDELLDEAFKKFSTVYFLTHVPPFRRAAISEIDGKPTDDDWAPHFTCQAIGKVLRKRMKDAPKKELTVLCGHTHGEGRGRELPNLKWITGGAEYGQPRVSEVFVIN